MKLHLAIAVAAGMAMGGLALPTAAVAEEPGASTPPAPLEHPWAVAATVLAATQADMNTGGIAAVQGHVDDLEKALAGAKDAILSTKPATGDIYTLTDGTADTLLGVVGATVAAKQTGSTQNTVAVNNPYPLIALYLGSYYDEIGKPEDAARVLDAGLSIYDMDGYISPLGEHKGWLLVERSAAADSLKRFDEVLDITAKGLALTDQPDELRAHLYRNRGFALTELGRLDESEDAYRESLKLEPGNATAENELAYLARLKAGGARQQGGLVPLAKPDPAQKPDI
jgi:tetratricopeptide (TPR) repeat protein